MIVSKRCLWIIKISLLYWLCFLVNEIFNFLPKHMIAELSALSEFLLHLVMIYVVYTIYKDSQAKEKENLFWLFYISVALFINDLTFYFIVYVPKNYLISISSINIILIFISYSLWVFPLIFMLSKILMKHMVNKNNFYRMFFVLLVIDLIAIYLFLASIDYAFGAFSWESISQIVSSIVEVIIFALAILCLIYSSSIGFSAILSGFVILISGDFIITYSYLTQISTIESYGELFWFLGVIFIFSGILLLQQDKNNIQNDWLRKSSAIRSYLSFWTFVISSTSILPFFILLYYFLPVNKAVFSIIPAVIMITGVIMVVFSSIIGKNIEKHFDQIACNIKNLMLGNKGIIQFNFSIDEFVFLQKFINDTYDLKEERDQTKKKIAEISTQLAHDIRSPLSVLKTVLSDLSSLPERKRIDAFNSIQRVTDIANNILGQYRNNIKKSAETEVEYTSEPVAITLESIVSEKRIQVINTNININLLFNINLYNAFIYIDMIEFKRVLSNLMNNAIEACKENDGIIDVKLNRIDGKIVIEIIDNGCGISKEKLNFLLENGGTFDKKDGSGLGLPHAMKKIIEWQGEYSFNSVLDKGTQLKIILPEAKPAEWFCSQINFFKKSTIIILDDDEYIHQIWNKRLPENFLLENNLTLWHFSNPNEIILFIKDQPIENFIFFLDYELKNHALTGLEVAKKLNIGNCSTLVTSRYEDENVRNDCKSLGMKIIPKFFAEIVPINIYRSTEIVLIDDEKTIRYYWKKSAESNEKSISVFSDPDDFMKIANRYSKNTTIYIDSSLNKIMKGEDFAKILYEMGYYNLILATGYPKSRFSHVTWIKDIVGKEPPWGNPSKQ